MYLKHLSIVNYKNIRQAELDLSKKINCFIGRNGEGKTNLLDAVYFLSFCKSHTNPTDTQSIHFDAEFMLLNGTYENEEQEMEISCGLKRGHKKTLKKNKKEYERLADHIGEIPLVIVSPSDSQLITGGSEERRKFMDGVISQYDHKYLLSLLAYNRALQQRNSLLRQEVTDNSQYEIWEMQMDLQSQYIYQKREEFVARFTPLFDRYHQEIAQNKEQVSFAYLSHLQEGEGLEKMLQESRSKDQIVGWTTKGIHRDDLEMRLNERPLKKTGSQGQSKTYLIALKLAQYEFLSQQDGKRPLLLFDDLFDKLDSERVEQIIRLMKEDHEFEQIFISDTDREHIRGLLKKVGGEYNLFSVENGEIDLIEANKP